MIKSMVAVSLLMMFVGCSLSKSYKPLYEVQPEKTQFEEVIQ